MINRSKHSSICLKWNSKTGMYNSLASINVLFRFRPFYVLVVALRVTCPSLTYFSFDHIGAFIFYQLTKFEAQNRMKIQLHTENWLKLTIYLNALLYVKDDGIEIWVDHLVL